MNIVVQVLSDTVVDACTLADVMIVVCVTRIRVEMFADASVVDVSTSPMTDLEFVAPYSWTAFRY